MGKKHKTIPKWLLEDEYHIIISQNGVSELFVSPWVGTMVVYQYLWNKKK